MLIPSLPFFSTTSTSWIWTSHFLILFLLSSIFAILLVVPQNFSLSFYSVKLLISIHSLNWQEHFLVLWISPFHIILFLFQECNNSFIFLAVCRGLFLKFYSVYCLPVSSESFFFSLLSGSLFHVRVCGGPGLAVLLQMLGIKKAGWKIFVCGWVCRLPSKFLRQGFGVSLGEPCPISFRASTAAAFCFFSLERSSRSTWPFTLLV